MDTRAYDAFISYSHAVDGKLAPRLQSAIRRFASPWYRRSTLRVFRDETNLSASPGLWSSIEKALQSSKHLVLLASPRAAASKWVARELEYWLANKTPQTLLIVLTEGAIDWSDSLQDFDWQRTDALPKSLAGSFVEEPYHLDLRSVSRAQDLANDNPAFRDTVAALTATLLGRSKDELIGEDIAIRRRARRTAWSIGAALLLLTILLGLSTWFALTQRDSLARSLQVVQGQKLAAEAQLVRAQSPNQLQLSALLSLEAMRLAPSAETEAQLRQTVALLLPPVRQIDLPPRVDSREGIVAVMLSPDGRSLAAIDLAQPGPRWWDVESGNEIRKFSTSDRQLTSGLAGAFTRDGSQILTASFTDIVFWDTSSGQVAQRVTTAASIRAIAVSADDRYLATGHYGGLVRVAERKSGREVLERKHEIIVNAVAFSPDSTLLASGSNDNTVRVWSIPDGKELLRLPHRFGVITVAFSPDGRAVASAGWEGVARIWDVASGNPMATFDHRSTVHSVAFSADGKRLATAGEDSTVRIWDRASGAEVTRATHPAQATGVAFSDDGRYVVTSTRGSVNLWKTVFGHEIAQLSHPDNIVVSLDFSPDGKRLVTAAGSTARIWNFADSQELYRLAHDHDLKEVAFSADGESIVTVTRPGADVESRTCVYVWAADSRAQRSRYCQEHSASSIDDQGGHVMLGFKDSLVIRFLQTAARVAEVKNVPELSFQSEVAVSPQRRRVAAANGSAGSYEINLFEVGSDAKPKAISMKEHVRQLAFSADERLLAAASDDAIVLWNADDGREINRVALARGANCVAFSADGRHLASGGSDQSVRVWELPAFREVARYELGGKVNQVTFNADMDLVAAASSDRTARVWRWRSDPISEACKRLNRNLTRAEWQTYLGDEPYRRTCPQLDAD